MAKRAVVECVDLPLIGSMLARATHPELILHQRTTGHNACRELGVTVWASLTPRRVQRNQILRFITEISHVEPNCQYLGNIFCSETL